MSNDSADFNYDRKLELLDREGLILKIQNQRLEIKHLTRCINTYLSRAVWRARIIRDAIKHLKVNRPINALSTLQDRVDDGDAVLKELTHGDV